MGMLTNTNDGEVQRSESVVIRSSWMEWLSAKVFTVLKTGRKIRLERRDPAFIEPVLSSIPGQDRLAVDIFCGSAVVTESR